MKACYFDPRSGEAVEVSTDSLESIIKLIHEMGSINSDRGHPTVELLRDDGSSLAVSTDEGRAFLVWIDPLGDSHHSVGEADNTSMVFDYFGSWSEAPPDQLVPIDKVTGCVAAFMSGGSPATDSVLFTPE